MKIINVSNEDFRALNTASSADGKHWEPAKPELLYPNFWEWILHYIFKKHFTFGQPYCVVCGKSEL